MRSREEIKEYKKQYWNKIKDGYNKIRREKYKEDKEYKDIVNNELVDAVVRNQRKNRERKENQLDRDAKLIVRKPKKVKPGYKKKNKERLEKELEVNVGLKIDFNTTSGHYKIYGRGELHIAILLENM